MRPIFFKSSSSARKTSPLSVLHRTFSENLMQDTVEMAEAVICKWTSSDQEDPLDSFLVSSLFSARNRREAHRYIQAVNDLQVTMQYLVSVNPGSEKQIQAQNLMESAMKRLEKEFNWILRSKREILDTEFVSVHSSRHRRHTRGRSALDSDSTDDSDGSFRGNSISPGAGERKDDVDAETMADLKLIADCLISAGHSKECLKLYKSARKSVVDEGLTSLGLEKLSFAQVQKMEPEVLEAKIKTWLRAVKIAVVKLFHGERILCDHVFSACATTSESCFAEIACDAALTLFCLPENVGKFRKTPELIFCTLDLYETISILLPEIESIFCFESTSFVRSQASESLTKLGESVSLMVEDFETAVQKDACKPQVPGGGVHPLTRYGMNYTSFLSDYSGSVAEILADWQLKDPPSLPESYVGTEVKNSSPIAIRLAWQILVLLCKIDAKTEAYKDPAISYLFLANNLQYVVSRVKISNLKLLLGEEWMARHEEKVKQYAARYEKLAWGKVLTSLPEDPTAEISLNQAKDCFRKFKTAFEEAYKKQLTWIVPDPTLREEIIKTPLARKLIPDYRAFYGRNRIGLGDLVRYTPEDIENYVSNLFLGTARSGFNLANDSHSNNFSVNFRSFSFYKSRSTRCGGSRKGDFLW